MAKELLLVGVGGLTGSVLRFLIFRFSSHLSPAWFPLSTFVVNLVGSFLIGLLFALVERSAGLAGTLRPLLMAGFCGGFTTFSAFSLENYQLLKDGQYAAFAAYTAASVLLGLAAVIFGVKVVALIAD
ncbi:MAG: fluoride efflux transporter CrcB [Spirochaetota bacterium]